MTKSINGRIILFENEMCRTVGLMATCNSCDRIVYADEKRTYQINGYCPECQKELEAKNDR